MWRRRLGIAMAAFGLVGPLSMPPAGATAPTRSVVFRADARPTDDSIPGRLIVKTTGGLPQAHAGFSPSSAATELLPDTYVLQVDPATEPDALGALVRDPSVVYAERDHVFHASVIPNDPLYSTGLVPESPYLGLIGAPAAWDLTLGSSGIVVAILDTGIDATHPDLTGKIVGTHNNVTPPVPCPNPDLVNGPPHGTFVAGIVGAVTNNSTGVAGLGWNTSLLDVQVLDTNGCGDEVDLAAGLIYAADHGAKVINLSLGGTGHGSTLDNAVSYAEGKGVVLVAAAGNAGNSTLQYPAALPGVISVGATDLADQKASFSSFGPWVDLMAPGVSIASTTLGATYASGAGTSFSAPLVSATAALILAAHPGISAGGVTSRLQRSAVPIAGTGTEEAWGRLDAGVAVTLPESAGFRVATSLGEVGVLGDASFYGSMAGVPLARPVVGIATTKSGLGYWMVASDGGIFSFGDAKFWGSMGGKPLNKPIVGMTRTVTGNGYWMVASDGGIFSFGDAKFWGSMGGKPLNKPVVGMATTKNGNGYWLVASDGGIFSFGDATFLGSTGSIVLNKPVVAMARTGSGSGYWMVATDGGIFAFGDAGFFGSTGGAPPAYPIAGMSPTFLGDGYWLVATNGAVFPQGAAPDVGSAVGQFAANIVSLATA